MRGRLLLPVVGFIAWGAMGPLGCSASKEGAGPGVGHGASSSTGGQGVGGLVIGTAGTGGSLGLGGSGNMGGMAPLPPHTLCSPDIPCGTGLTCVKGKGEPDHCAPTGMACTMDSDCGGDRYCCAEGCLT